MSMSFVPATMILLLCMVNFLIIVQIFRYYSLNKEFNIYCKIYNANLSLLVKNFYRRKALIKYVIAFGGTTIILCIASFVLQKYNMNNAYLYVVLSAFIVFGVSLVIAIVEALKKIAFISFQLRQSEVQETFIIEYLATV